MGDAACSLFYKLLNIMVKVKAEGKYYMGKTPIVFSGSRVKPMLLEILPKTPCKNVAFMLQGQLSNSRLKGWSTCVIVIPVFEREGLSLASASFLYNITVIPVGRGRIPND